jgi:hypothetical protein
MAIRARQALMIGANHEMGHEMPVAGLPTDQCGTPFQHPGNRSIGKEDIGYIHKWKLPPLSRSR